MRLNAKELIADARVTAPTLPPAAAKLMTEMANRLDVQFAALCESRDQVKRLTAENWNLRDVLRQLIAGRPGGCYCIKWEPLIFKALNETTATDAAIASLRAEGVEIFAAHCQKRHGEMLKTEPNEAVINEAITATRRAGEFALYYAAQLRSQSAPSPRVAATPETAAIARQFEQVKGAQS